MVKIAADHLTITITEVREVDDKTVTASTILTADYQFMRDGVTAIGLIANVDIKIDGELSEDEMEQVTDDLGELQKALENKPFALNVRLYGEALTIGSVRLPVVDDQLDLNPAQYVGGRYKNAGDKPLPKPKTIKTTSPKPEPVPALPSGAYGSSVLPSGGRPVDWLDGEPIVPPGVLPPAAMYPAPGPYTQAPLVPSGGHNSREESVPPMSAPASPAPLMPQPARPVGCGVPNNTVYGYAPALPAPYQPACVPSVVPCPVQPNVGVHGPIQTQIVITGEFAALPPKPSIIGTWYREIGPSLVRHQDRSRDGDGHSRAREC